MKVNLLVKCALTLVNSYGNVTGLVQNIPLAVRTKVKAFLIKHGVEEGSETSVYNNKIIKAITEEDENEEEEEGSMHEERKEEENEVYKFVERINAGKKVQFKCISGNVYSYGTQRVSLTLDRNSLKVKKENEGQYISLDKFTALNEQTEMRSRLNSDAVS